MDGCDVGSLETIAGHASISQVAKGGAAPVLTANYVIDLVRKPGILFANQAVFAIVPGTVGYFAANGTANFTEQKRESGGPWPSPFS